MPILCGQGHVHRHSQLVRRSGLQKIVVTGRNCARTVILALPAPLGFLLGLTHIAILAFLAQRGLLLFNDSLNQGVQTLRVLFIALAPGLPCVTGDPRVLRVTCLDSSQNDKNLKKTSKVTYHVTKLLVESVASPTACLLVRDLGSDPIAEMLLVFFRELCPPKNDVNIGLRIGETGYLAYSSPGRRPPGFLYTSGV